MRRPRLPLLLLFSALATSGFGEILRFGVEADLAPISFIGPDGRPRGFVIDLIEAVGREAGFEPVFVAKPRVILFEEFDRDAIDALSAVVRTREREKRMAFSVTHVELRNAIFVQSGATPLQSQEDLTRVRVAVVSGARTDELLASRGEAGSVLKLGSTAELLRAVNDGRADAAVTTRVCANAIITREGLKNVVASPVPPPEDGHTFHVAFHPDDRLRLAAFNEGLRRVREHGLYDRLYEQWIGTVEPRPVRFRDLQPYFFPTLLVLLTVLGLLIWQRRNMKLLADHAEALRRSEQRLTLVLEGGDHGLWDWDVRSGKIERNSRTAGLLGYSDAELPPTFDAWLDLVHPEDRPSVEAACNQLTLANHDTIAVQYRMRAKDGGWRWISSSGKVLDRDPDGRPRRAAGTHTDVTAQKRMEEERVTFQQKVLEAQKLESLGLLAGGIAHDFNNLLTVVLGQATLMRISEKTPEGIELSLQQIESAARRASELCRQMLVYAGGGTFAMQTVDLNSLLTSMAPLLRTSVRKDAKLDFDLAGDLDAIEADPTQMRQVVMNLVINASEALGPEGGTISIITSSRAPTHAEMRAAVHVSDLPPGRRVCFTVRDTGTGMLPSVRAKIFEPFYTTKFTGRGLGLAAVLGIVRAHRGIFSVHSEPGAGSTFTLFLAASPHRVLPTALSEARLPARAAPRATVLVADDEPAVLAMSVAVLNHHGYNVVSAATGREAVNRFNRSPDQFEAVILDFTMPELNGVGALMEIRRTRPTIPAVLMSGFGAADAFERLPAENPPLFLQKPFAQHELLARVAEAVALSQGTGRRSS